MTTMRRLRLFTHVRRVHHIRWSYGYVFTPLRIGWFERYGWRRCDAQFHDCDATGIC